MSTAETYVYFIWDGATYTKIGVSRNPLERLRQLQTSSPRRLQLVMALPGDREDEAMLHEFFSKDHAMGEWFRTSRTMMKFGVWVQEVEHEGPIREALMDWADDGALNDKWGSFQYREHERGF